MLLIKKIVKYLTSKFKYLDSLYLGRIILDIKIALVLGAIFTSLPIGFGLLYALAIQCSMSLLDFIAFIGPIIADFLAQEWLFGPERIFRNRRFDLLFEILEYFGITRKDLLSFNWKLKTDSWRAPSIWAITVLAIVSFFTLLNWVVNGDDDKRK